ncbi:MAG TPA: hydantoinase B/oxoprolinase family protein [Solirubrobacteraceae bacterium]|nr:hydantoinase B/oxoprolinase family protein [Solirubrobacteraceae bacterium]
MSLRDLSDARFAERYACDRFTATVLANRFRYVVEHMCAQLLTTAFSPILRDFYDFAATVTGAPAANYPTPAVSNSIILFTGTMTDSIRNTIEEYGVQRLQPGDVIVANDPYRTGTHVNDLLFCRPVFADGAVAGFVNLKAHQLDMGGAVPGGFSTTKRTTYENGLVLSPRALYRAREPVRETFSLIFDNVRFAELLLPDMITICANLDLGERLLTETIERYGVAAVHGAIEYVCDASAERIADGLAALPDGEWEGEAVLDADGVDAEERFVVHAKVIKRGDRAEVDLSGTSRQARTSINGTALDAKSTVGTVLKLLFDPRSPFTSGVIRPVDVVLPEGTIVSALPPDGPAFIYWEGTQALLTALLRAFSQVIGAAAFGGDHGSANLHSGFGVHPDGTPWAVVGAAGGEQGPYGATDAGDGEPFAIGTYQANGMSPAIEAIEHDFPVVILRREPIPDTGGAGEHRGGDAIVKDSVWFEPAIHNCISLRFREPSGFGVNGGRDGATGGVWIWEDEADHTRLRPLDAASFAGSTPMTGTLDPRTNAPDPAGEYVWFGRRPVWQTPAGGLLRYLTNGAGGWGDPLARDPERVRVDVRDGFVTVAGAARDYGVVIEGDPERDPEGLVVDGAATERLRRERHGGR